MDEEETEEKSKEAPPVEMEEKTPVEVEEKNEDKDSGAAGEVEVAGEVLGGGGFGGGLFSGMSFK